MSRSASHSSSALSNSEYTRLLEEQLVDSEMHNQELQTCLNSALAMIGTLDTHCYFARETIARQQKQIYAQDNKKRGSRAKQTNNSARVLTTAEGHQELLQLREEARLKMQRQTEELTRKAAEDDAQCKRRADPLHTFVGPLNKSR